MGQQAWRLFDHRADLGLEIRGRDKAGLFANAAHALFSQITDRRRVRARRTLYVSADGADWPELMANWLRELLYLFNGKALLIRCVAIDTIAAFSLQARVAAEPFDPKRHTVKKEIKAVTFHQLGVRQTDVGWQARIIFDL